MLPLDPKLSGACCLSIIVPHPCRDITTTVEHPPKPHHGPLQARPAAKGDYDYSRVSTILNLLSCHVWGRMRIRFIAAGFLAALAVPGSAHDIQDGVIEAKDLICQFHNTGVPRSMLRQMVEGERFDMLLVIEAIDPASGRARSVSSRQTGTKSLRYYKTRTAVHFVQDLGSSVVVTTITSCEEWGRKGEEELCVRYRALNSWHFDMSVHRDPDAAFGKLGTSSYYGSCEPWYLNGVTTVEHTRQTLKLSGRP